MIRGTPLRLAQTYILVNTRGWRPWCPSIQCSVPLGAGGFFPKIASQRALVARGGLCEFGARSNWPPGMPALIMFPQFQFSFIFNFVTFPPTKMKDSSFFSKISTTLSLLSFSYSGIGHSWKCVEALTPTVDQGVVPPWRKILLLEFCTFLSQLSPIPSKICGTFINDIEISSGPFNHFRRSRQKYWPQFP